MAECRSDSDQDSNGDMDGDSGRINLLGCEEEFKTSCAKELALLALIEKTGYNMVQENGQRKYGDPTRCWEGPPPPRGCEVFVGKIPRDMYEDELVPLFDQAGKIYEFRLMMEFSGENRGYAFVMYTNRETAQRAIQMLDNYEIRPGKFIGVCVSLDNCRLFIGSIPKDKRKEEIMEEMTKVTDGVVDVIVYPSSTDKSRNRGFAFVEYESHKAAAMARRKLIPGTFQLWGQSIQVDWAEPEKDVDEEIMQRVRVLYVRNLMLGTTEETLRQEFSRFKPGSVERVKKLTDYAFVHYRCRDDAIKALSLMNGAQIDGTNVEVTLAKPAVLKDGSVVGRRNSSRGHAGNPTTAAGGGGGNGTFAMHRNDGRMMGDGVEVYSPLSNVSLPPLLGNPFYPGAARDDLDRCVYPLFPGTPLSPTSLLSLKQTQIASAVNLLEFYCRKNNWSQPEYHLYSKPGQDGKLMLLYKVVITSTQNTFVPDKLCMLLDDAKELAAQTALWNLVMYRCGLMLQEAPRTFQLWGQSIQVDWAEPEKDVDEEIMQRVRVLYVRNLMLGTTEETLRQEFSRFKPGSVERVKKLTDYAFVHYRCRDDAIKALSLMNGAQIDGTNVEVTLAKPAVLKDGSVVGRRNSSRGHVGNPTTAAGGGGGNGTFAMHRNDGRMMGDGVEVYSPLSNVSLPPLLGNPFYPGAARDDLDRCVYPVSRHTPLPHQPAVTKADPDRLGCQSAGILLPQKQLVTARVPSVLQTWTRRETDAPLQGLSSSARTRSTYQGSALFC
ncbi:hypothetical protein Q5P01_002916 [Channa striata]|uniref:Probable RNA-binding protein 46 n=1 Tax=Channa striata TaxID=64152 RepID=A0AA88NU00_CHASR|nr:hypothetical protein Q5P01_002916 [Channa striata]